MISLFGWCPENEGPLNLVPSARTKNTNTLFLFVFYRGPLGSVPAISFRVRAFKMSKLIKMIAIVVLLSVVTGCCALPDVPGPIGIPGC
jgi:hypothetical protein